MVCVVLVSAVCGLTAPGAAGASALRRIVSGTVLFESDGWRYAAWQTHEAAPGGAAATVTVFDSQRWRTKTMVLPAECNLADEEAAGRNRRAAHGRFLVLCGGASPVSGMLLDAASGTLIPLAQTPYGFVEWFGVGLRYALGRVHSVAKGAMACKESAPEVVRQAECLVVRDLATGRVSYRREYSWPDIDRPGAPPACPRLQRKLNREASGEGSDYHGGLLAISEGEGPYVVAVEGCRRRLLALASGGGLPGDEDLRSGLLTWDTGHPGFEELPAQAPIFRRGVLYSYGLTSHRRRSWKLPAMLVEGAIEPEGRGARRIRRVLGYSTHNRSAVFWVATEAIHLGEVNPQVLRSAVYAARL